MPFCNNCGKEIVEGASFCPNCGAAVDNTAQSANTQQNTQTPPEQNNTYQANTQQNNAQYNTQQQYQPQSNGQYNAQYGAPQYEAQQPNGQNAQNSAQQAFDKFIDTADTTSQFDMKDIEDNKVISLFAYLGILFLVPLIARPDSKYARFHTNQGLVLFIVWAIYGVAAGIITAIFTAIGLLSPALLGVVGIISALLGIGSLFFVVLMILGIVNSCTGKAKELPLIGGFKILK